MTSLLVGTITTVDPGCMERDQFGGYTVTAQQTPASGWDMEVAAFRGL